MMIITLITAMKPFVDVNEEFWHGFQFLYIIGGIFALSYRKLETKRNLSHSLFPLYIAL